ncbi:TadE/TadG family type IV pilus assembly protein [Marimonas arenosa]|uniref:Pilus assembly protein n=1 Tax=Marimonas arenosa TaxID=1795305 RepID=A0AAE4B3Q3_9RHOB|nr:TadE/TadG family type IV pilus assembly protein [Marimonas arenosa]MDQ2089452.1 pilus assembly protein [Marimonas arenosa]
MTDTASKTTDGTPGSLVSPCAVRLARVAGKLRTFRRDESGVMIAYSVVFFLIMLIIGGIGVDFMHYEMKRTRLQNTLDRAVLAAADMQQPLDPAAVVEDYLAKAGLNATLTAAPTVNAGLNYRDVTAGATLIVPTQFIHMLGFDSLVAPALAQAEEKIEAVEIALVLDISGSMGSNNRLVNLKPAAREFIDAVMDLTQAGGVSVSIVPYNTQVNAGETLLQHYDVSNEHNFSNCVNFEDQHFDSAALDPAESLERTMHFDMFSYYSGETDPSNPSYPPNGSELPKPVCPTRAGSEITVMSTDAAALKNQINALTAGGNTSIDIGMKWAATLLDPGTRPVITQMIADGDVNAFNAGRPLDYGTPNTMKVIVVMTDGQNTNQYKLPDTMRDARSDVYYFPGEPGRISIRYNRSSPEKFYYPHSDTWNTKPYGWSGDFIDDNNDGEPDDGVVSVVQRLSYQELFAWYSVAQNARYHYGPLEQTLGGDGYGRAWDEWYSNLPEVVNGTMKDTRLQNICGAAKTEGVMIYAIGFEATSNGNSQLRNCASSPSHFFNATGVSIRDVFQAIAISIAQLRLTQ